MIFLLILPGFDLKKIQGQRVVYRADGHGETAGFMHHDEIDHGAAGMAAEAVPAAAGRPGVVIIDPEGGGAVSGVKGTAHEAGTIYGVAVKREHPLHRDGIPDDLSCFHQLQKNRLLRVPE